VRRWFRASAGHCLKNTTDLLKIFDVPGFGTFGHLVEPADGGWFQTRFVRIVGRIDHLDFDLYGVLASLYPPFSFFASFCH
jgi:hypothetical protein